MFSSQTTEQNKHNGTRQLKMEQNDAPWRKRIKYTKKQTERIDLQQIVHEVLDRMGWHRERPVRTVGNLGAEHLTHARGSAFVNDSGEPINGRVSVSTDHDVPRVRGT